MSLYSNAYKKEGTGLGRYQSKPDPNKTYLRRELRPVPKQYTKNDSNPWKLRTNYDQRLWPVPPVLKETK